MSENGSLYYSTGIHLWRTVIFRAQLEAVGDYKPATEDKETLQELMDAAREFLVNDSQDLRIVVHLAQLPMPYRDFVKEMKKRYGMPNA